MLLHYIRGQRGVDLDGKCKKQHDTRVTVSPPPPPNTHTHTHTQAYYYSVRPLQEIKELRYQSELYSQICQI